MERDTETLVNGMIQGDESAFDELYRLYSGKMYRMACFITGNRSDSEDILQETFVKCYLNRKSLKDPGLFEGWLSRILVRTAWKTEKKRRELSLDAILESEETAGLKEKLQEDLAEGPLEQVVRKEGQQLLWMAVEGLDVKYRTVVFLFYYEGLGTKEIAKITGTLEGTVKSRLFKARKLLRKELGSPEVFWNGYMEAGRRQHG